VNSRRYEGYDLIGDVHGCGQALVRLLEKLGYTKKYGVYQHTKRQVIFVGDIVDRGPRIRDALATVYNMVQSGHAQMVIGNHEYNVYCHATPDPQRKAMAYLREHNPHNDRLVAETFEQFANYPGELKEYLEWFSRLPLFLEFERFRVVHACWDQQYIEQYRTAFGHHCVTPEIIAASVHHKSFEGRILDRLMRGTSIKLPNNEKIVSRDGYERRIFRTKFWARNPKTYSDVVYQPDPLPEHLESWVLNQAERDKLLSYSETEKPVFFGHYWLQGTPEPVRPNICCLDYSAVKFGRLVAYRYNFEPHLNESQYEWVYIDPED